MAEIENLMLANHAEAVNGLLYLTGGGWTHHWRGPAQAGQPRPSQIGFAATIIAPAGEVTSQFPFAVRITAGDGTEVVRADGTMTIGSGDAVTTKRAALAGNFGVAFPVSGRYELGVEIPGSRRSVEFWVHDQPMPGSAPSPGSRTAPGSENLPGYI